MYTFPFATVATVNFTALPAWSRFAFCELFHNSFARFVASYAWSTAAPPPVSTPFGPFFAGSIAHTIPFSVADDAEIDGDEPENPNPVGVVDAAVVLNIPFDVLKVNA
jgi:hypothetical protein